LGNFIIGAGPSQSSGRKARAYCSARFLAFPKLSNPSTPLDARALLAWVSGLHLCRLVIIRKAGAVGSLPVTADVSTSTSITWRCVCPRFAVHGTTSLPGTLCSRSHARPRTPPTLGCRKHAVSKCLLTRAMARGTLMAAI
jgi:hypothetical protein